MTKRWNFHKKIHSGAHPCTFGRWHHHHSLWHHILAKILTIAIGHLPDMQNSSFVRAMKRVRVIQLCHFSDLFAINTWWKVYPEWQDSPLKIRCLWLWCQLWHQDWLQVCDYILPGHWSSYIINSIPLIITVTVVTHWWLFSLIQSFLALLSLLLIWVLCWSVPRLSCSNVINYAESGLSDIICCSDKKLIVSLFASPASSTNAITTSYVTPAMKAIHACFCAEWPVQMDKKCKNPCSGLILVSHFGPHSF